METEKELRNSEWKQIILKYFNDNVPAKVVFKYPGFDRPTLRSGMILRVGDYSFALKDIKEGEENYSYDFIVEVKELRN